MKPYGTLLDEAHNYASLKPGEVVTKIIAYNYFLY